MWGIHLCIKHLLSFSVAWRTQVQKQRSEATEKRDDQRRPIASHTADSREPHAKPFRGCILQSFQIMCQNVSYKSTGGAFVLHHSKSTGQTSIAGSQCSRTYVLNVHETSRRYIHHATKRRIASVIRRFLPERDEGTLRQKRVYHRALVPYPSQETPTARG